MSRYKSMDDLPNIQPDFAYYTKLCELLKIQPVTWQHNPDFCPICTAYRKATDWYYHGDVYDAT